MCHGHAHIGVGSKNIKDVSDVNVTPFNVSVRGKVLADDT